MERKKYNQCIADAMRGKKLGGPERKREFCITAKICSGKASSREQANEQCEISAQQPKERKAKRGRRAPAANQGGMRLVLLTTSDCKPCTAARNYLQNKIDSGLIQVLNIQKSDEAADLAAQYGFQSVPKLLVLDEEGKPFSELQITDTEQMIETT